MGIHWCAETHTSYTCTGHYYKREKKGTMLDNFPYHPNVHKYTAIGICLSSGTKSLSIRKKEIFYGFESIYCNSIIMSPLGEQLN